MSEFILWQQEQIAKFVELYEAQMERLVIRLDHGLQDIEGQVIERVMEHVSSSYEVSFRIIS